MELPSLPALVQAPQLSGAACVLCLPCIATAPPVPVAKRPQPACSEPFRCILGTQSPKFRCVGKRL